MTAIQIVNRVIWILAIICSVVSIAISTSTIIMRRRLRKIETKLRGNNMKATIVPTGKERLERLYKRLKKNYPEMDIRFVDESLIFEKFRLVKYKVVLYETFDEKPLQVCDAIWGWGSYGYERNLLEFYYHDDPIGNITELKAYNLFVEAMRNEGLIEGERTT